MSQTTSPFSYFLLHVYVSNIFFFVLVLLHEGCVGGCFVPFYYSLRLLRRRSSLTLTPSTAFSTPDPRLPPPFLSLSLSLSRFLASSSTFHYCFCFIFDYCPASAFALRLCPFFFIRQRRNDLHLMSNIRHLPPTKYQ